MEKRKVKTYTEVKLAETTFDKAYKNPMARTFQNEYALFEAVAGLFEHVERRSMSIETMKMYFRELPVRNESEYEKHGEEISEGEETVTASDNTEKKHPKQSQEKLRCRMQSLVARDVIGRITFPMMDRCAAEASTIQLENGTHWFIFTDGIYGFAVRMKLSSKNKPIGIEVRDLTDKKRINRAA